MIKFVAEGPDNIRLIGFCLSRQNCERLLAGYPIEVDLRKDLNLPYRARVGIFGGETEQKIYERFKAAGYIDEETQVHIDEKLEAEAAQAAAEAEARSPEAEILDRDVRSWLEVLQGAGLLTFEDFPLERRVAIHVDAELSRRMLALPIDALMFFNDLVERNHPGHPSRKEPPAKEEGCPVSGD